MIYHLRHRRRGEMIEERKIQQNIYLAATSQAKSVPNRDFQTSAAGFDWREAGGMAIYSEDDPSALL